MSYEIPKNGIIGKNVPVRDAAMEVTGQMRCVADMKLPGMLYAKILFSPVPHARIKSIGTTQARALGRVRAVVCYKGSLRNRHNGNGEDKDINPPELVFNQTARFVGDKMAAVAASTEEIARRALSLISVGYEELPFYLDPEEAMKESAHPIHQGDNIIMGSNDPGDDVDDTIRDADHVFRHGYEISAMDRCSLETHVSITGYDASSELAVWTPAQGAFDQKINLQRILELPMSKIHVISPVIDGGFGSKIDLVTEPVITFLAIKTGRPVKMVYNKTEEFCCTRIRHTAGVDLTMAVKKGGTITAADETIILNAGAHTSAIMSVCWTAGGKSYKLLKTRNMRCWGIPVCTDTPVASAMGGFSSPQQFFPVSFMMNKIVQSSRLDPSDVFLKNLADPFGVAYNDGESFSNFRLKDCVVRGRELIDWYEARKQMETSRKEKGHHLIGVGMAYGSYRTSMPPFMLDIMGITIRTSESGTIVFTTGTSDMRNGSVTTRCMLISRVLGTPLDHIAYIKTDTGVAMSDLGVHASRDTYTSDHVAIKTTRVMRGKIVVPTAEPLDTTTDNLDFHDDIVWRVDIYRKFANMREVAVHAREKH